jgi:hypothetical protein
MQPQFAIDGPDWSVSFQRRVGAADRGALPYFALDSSPDRMRVLVPLRTGEALWIAVMAGPAVVIEGRAGDRPLRVEKFSLANDGRALQMFDAILDADRWIPIDAVSVSCADDPAATGDPLTLSLERPLQSQRRWITIVPATPALYERLSGLPAPAPSTEQDEYQGWLLP